MKQFISEDEWKQVVAILGVERALAIRIGPRERVVPGLASRWLLEVDAYVPGTASPSGYPYAVTTFYVPVMLPGDEERRRRAQAESDRRIAELVHGKRVEHVFLPDSVTDERGRIDLAKVTPPDGVVYPAPGDGGWSHCGDHRNPHAQHTHTVTFLEGSYPDVVCPGTPMGGGWCAPEEGKLNI